ncbi:MAG: hypothetical protein JW861_13775, partial [Bacteroidales bacterium]|nr:hypothetical protein [Bacteroidales bacterium]
MNRIILLPFWLISLCISAQDTITIQTLTFDSITTRRGIWQFPEGETFRKILMVHTLKCDYATTHDPYPCGEWDYLTYNQVHVHTGVYDSILNHHPDFTFVNGLSTDSLPLSGDPTFSFFRHRHAHIDYPDTLELLNAEIGWA